MHCVSVAVLQSLRDFYDTIDEDVSGQVDPSELQAALKRMGQVCVCVCL